jgi:acetyl esterase/lipase
MTREACLTDIGAQLREGAGNEPDGLPRLEPFFLEGEGERPLMVICPGGGYGFTSPRESAPVARAYNAAGYHCLVLHYRVAPSRYPEGLTDLSRTIALSRRNSAVLGVRPNRIFLCGFSAGGHLAASLGVHWDKPVLQTPEVTEEGMNRPDALVLSYPVITEGEYAHRGSFENLLGPGYDREAAEYHSLEKQVTDKTPPVFIWHTQSDRSVPVENTLFFAGALHRAGVAMEMHVFPKGDHGAALATEESDTAETKYADPHVARWHNLSVEWLNGLN